jgi:3,4-dihydroxy 2-butanone 4-phosphate synthase/GTP cyclohydrolase II
MSTSYAGGAVLENLADARAAARPRGRPFVTLAYAQSLDGSITIARGQRTTLSGPEAMRFTHALRATHDAILVGIGTVLADDPELGVRLVDGPDPQPIVVDSRLRTPDAAKLLARPGRTTWIATATPAPRGAASAGATAADGDDRRARIAHIEARGGRVVACPALPNGWVDLQALLARLGDDGVAHVMVEGGARIIGSFLQARLVDYLVVTIAPQLLAGLPAVAPGVRPGGRGVVASVARWVSARLGDDLVLGGEVAWPPG